MTQAEAAGDHQLRRQLQVPLRHRWLVGGVALAAVVLATVLSYWQAPKYESTAAVVSSIPEVSGLFSGANVRVLGQDAARRVGTQVELFRSAEVARSAAEEIRYRGDLEELLRQVKIVPVAQTDVIEVRVTDTDPDRAARIANAFAAAFVRFQGERTMATIDNLADQIEKKLTEAKAAVDKVDAEFQEALSSKNPTAAQTLTTSRDAALREYTDLKQRFDDLQLQASLQQESAVVVDPAVPATEPSSPKPVRDIVLAGILGLMAGLGLAYLRDRMDDRIRTKEDLEAHLEAPLLATVPFFGEKKRKLRSASPIRVHDTGGAAEAFRRLRTNLRFLNLDSPLHVIGVSSSRTGDGKSTVAANLAASMAESGLNVVLMGADLRKPSLQKLYGDASGRGLTTVLTGETALEDSMVVVDVGADRHMLFLPSGPVPPNPAEMLGSHAMVSVLDELRRQADVVVVDLPPLMPIADAAVLAPFLDGVLVVVRGGVTRHGEVEQTRDALDRVRARTLGGVINAVRSTKANSDDGYYYGYEYVTAPERANGSKPVPVTGNGHDTEEAPSFVTTVATEVPEVAPVVPSTGAEAFRRPAGRTPPAPHRLN